jgi:hypothetical protein
MAGAFTRSLGRGDGILDSEYHCSLETATRRHALDLHTERIDLLNNSFIQRVESADLFLDDTTGSIDILRHTCLLPF